MHTMPAARAIKTWCSRSALIFAAAVAVGGPSPTFAEDAPTYNRDVRPILSDRCFTCHGPDSAARQADLRLDRQENAHAAAILPGDADQSELIVRVTSNDPELKMPPPDSKKPPLTPAQIETLRRWIDAGGKY